MKDFSGYIKYFIITLACALTLSSCVYDSYPDDAQSAGEQLTDDMQDPDKAFLVLHISPVNTTRAEGYGDVTESIESLRIIMLNESEEGKITIERNERIPLNRTDFPYAFTQKTVPGKKKFYFIANEDRVTNITYSNQQEADKTKTLKELLDAYTEESDATNFEDWINSVYFLPTYTIENNEIFLPYTAFYGEIEVTEADKSVKSIELPDMYIVPVATKFFFRFYNYHQYKVEIKNLSIKSIASQNFLLGHVDAEDHTKDFDGEEMYWVNWLAKVAEKTQDDQFDNTDINDKYGWIFAYQLPETNVHEEKVLISKDNVATIPISTDEKEKPRCLGPYYFPESCYKQDNNTTQEQDYLLHLHLHDKEVDSSTSNDFEEDLRIGNVKALFRDTSVLITVTMKNGDVEAYAQIEKWEHGDVSGWADGGSIIP